MHKLTFGLFLCLVQPLTAMETDHRNQQILDGRLYNELMQKYVNVARVQQLIDDGADVNRRLGKSNKHRTLLHCCIRRSFDESCRLLIANGANPNINRMDYVLRENQWEPIIAETPLVTAIKHCNPYTIKLLIGAGADVNTPEMDGTTPLVAACEHQTAEICKLLIDKKATICGIPETRAILGNTKPRSPVWPKVVEICTLFLKSGLDPLIKTQ